MKGETKQVEAEVIERPLDEIASDVLKCGLAWEPQVCLIGNVRADEIARLAIVFLEDRLYEKPTEPASLNTRTASAEDGGEGKSKLDGEKAELLPCGFCGGDADFEKLPAYGWKVRCVGRGCFVEVKSLFSHTQEGAAKNWNTRAGSWQDELEMARKSLATHVHLQTVYQNEIESLQSELASLRARLKGAEKWIEIKSEADLPTDTQDYQVTIYWNGQYKVDTCFYGLGEWCYSRGDQRVGAVWQGAKVIAWRELPKPYQPETKDGE